MRKVLFVHHVSEIGGGSYCLLNILKEIDRSQIEPIVLLKNDGPLVNEIKKLGIEVLFNERIAMMPLCRKISVIGFTKEIISAIISMFSFFLMLRHIECKVVYLNSMMIYHYLLPSKLLGKKTITHIRENWPANQFVIQRSLISYSIGLFSDRVFAINKYSSGMFSQLKSPKLNVVYDWIDMSVRFKSIPLNHVFHEDTTNLKVFLYTGGSNAIKGPREIITTFTKVMTNPSYRLLVLGDINDFATKDSFIADVIKSDKRIKCLPPLYEITHLIQQSYCVLSFFTRPHANLALAESVILQTPVVAATTPESLEYSLDGELAILFPFGDMKAYISKLEDIDTFVNKTKQNLIERSQIIKEMFDKDRNSMIINHVISSL